MPVSLLLGFAVVTMAGHRLASDSLLSSSLLWQRHSPVRMPCRACVANSSQQVLSRPVILRLPVWLNHLLPIFLHKDDGLSIAMSPATCGPSRFVGLWHTLASTGR